jgi:predicted dehydrogenase
VDSGECDAVLVATPSWTHGEIGEYALDAGLHVMMEKPIALSLHEGEELLRHAGADQVFAVMLNQRVRPAFRAMKEIVTSGRLGPITRTHWTMTHWFRPQVYFQASDWRATWRGEGGGLLLNQCIHNLDIFQWVCGMPSLVHGFCSFGKYHPIEVEDEATAYLEYANGATGVFIASTGEAPGANRFDVVGDLGTLSYDGERLELHENTPGSARYSRETNEMFGMPETRVHDLTARESVDEHALLLANFVDAIVGDAELIAPARDGLASLALAGAIHLSSWERRAVALPLDVGAHARALQERIAGSTLREKTDVDVEIDMEKSYR